MNTVMRRLANHFVTLSSLMLALSLTGCAAGPDYVQPEPETGSGWAEPPAVAGEARLDGWWQQFGDPTLTRLVEQVRAENRDLQQAVTRVAEARALRQGAAAGHVPTVDARASVTDQRLSRNGPLPLDRIPGLERDQTIVDIGFDASWEIDLFGRVRRAVEAADARIGQRLAEQGAVELMVTAEVARNYLTLRGLRRRLEVSEAAVTAADETLGFIRKRYLAGAADARQLAQAETEVTALRAVLPQLRGEIRATAAGIAVLSGHLPETEMGLVDTPLPNLELRPVPVGERADILRRRPDVAAAERALAAATAGVGLAEAERFPRLAVSAGGGFQALDGTDLISNDSERWSIVPFISWRVFDGGRIRAEIHASDARLQAAGLAWEQAVLAALGDAEQAMARYDSALDSLQLQSEAVAAAERNVGHAESRYRAGAIPLIELLDARRALYGAQATQAEVHTRAATSLVALFKALGGGWNKPDRLADRP